MSLNVNKLVIFTVEYMKISDNWKAVIEESLNQEIASCINKRLSAVMDKRVVIFTNSVVESSNIDPLQSDIIINQNRNSYLYSIIRNLIRIDTVSNGPPFSFETLLRNTKISRKKTASNTRCWSETNIQPPLSEQIAASILFEFNKMSANNGSESNRTLT